MVEFRVLGPLDARGPAGSASLGGAKQQLLLALLVLHAGEPVSRTAIIDALWPERPPPSARQSVDSYLSRIRAALRAAGADGELISSGTGGIRLRVADGSTDCDDFAELALSARAALADGEPLTARESADQALALWRGEALAGIAEEHAIRAYASALEEQRLQVFETRAEADLELGHHVDVISDLRTAASRHPTRERLQSLLMLALYRAGRQAEALDVYRAARAHLNDELGLEPGPALRDLQARILHHDPRLAAASPPTEPTPRPSRQPRGPLHQTASSGKRWRALRVGLAALLPAVVVVAVVIVAGAGSGSASISAALRAPALGVFDPGDGQPRAAVALGAVPTGLASGFGSEWASSYDEGTLLRIDPSDSAVTQTVQVGIGAAGVAAAAGDLWVADSLMNRVTRVDAATNVLVQQIQVGAGPVAVAAGAGAVWVANQGDGTVSRVDPLTGAVLSVTSVGPAPSGLAVGDGAVWVALGSADAVARLDPRTGQLEQTIQVGTRPSAIAVGRDGVWVANQLDSTVSLIDPDSDSVVLTRAVAGSPSELAAAGAVVWVAGGEGRLTIVRASGQAETIAMPSPVTALAIGPVGLLVGVSGIGADHRGGTLVARIADPAFEVMDPSACCDIPANVLGLSYDGLLAFSKAPSNPGRLVPDLALAIPAAQDGGRTYTFRLRPNLHYWNGEPVRASDFVRGFERAAQSSDLYAGYLAALPGATACPRAPGCDLRAAVVADDQAGTLTLRLSHPDPNLLTALGQANFAPDPGGRGIRLGTGPYRVTRQVVGHLVVFERNRYFREWSPAAQPAGYPDRIVLHLDGTTSGDVAAVLAGRADWTFDQPTARQLTAIQLRSPGQLHTYPLPEAEWLDLNTREAPFNDLRVRQALNLAIDRNRIVKLYGGPAEATPTCQVIPPTVLGHVPYCPYTRAPSPSGRYVGPNLARARRLIVASGTRGDDVTLATDPADPQDEPVARYTVSLLRTLGYRAHLRVLTPSSLSAVLNDYRHPPQMHPNSWIADVPSPSDWITLQLSCAAWHPPTQLTNHALFCDPTVDRLAARAAEHQSTNPAAAARLWARADRDITNLAPWVPTVNETGTDLVSARVGNYQYVPTIGALIDQLWVR